MNDLLNNPLLMALLASMQGAKGPQVGAAQPVQSNPNIFMEGGVWKNIPPANPEPPAIPYVAPGDYATEQYLMELVTQQKAIDDHFAAEAARQEAEAKREHELKLEGVRQEGGQGKARIEQEGGIQRSLIDKTGTILNNELMNAEEKLSIIKQLYATQAIQAPPSAPEPSPEINRPLMKATTPGQNMKDVNVQAADIKSLLDKYNQTAPTTRPKIGTTDFRFAQQAEKDPALAADLARRLVIFGTANKLTPDQIIAEISVKPEIPKEIKALVVYYAKQYGGKI